MANPSLISWIHAMSNGKKSFGKQNCLHVVPTLWALKVKPITGFANIFKVLALNLWKFKNFL